MELTPVGKRMNNRLERLPVRGKAVFDARRHFSVDAPRYQPGFLQVTQRWVSIFCVTPGSSFCRREKWSVSYVVKRAMMGSFHLPPSTARAVVTWQAGTGRSESMMS